MGPVNYSKLLQQQRPATLVQQKTNSFLNFFSKISKKWATEKYNPKDDANNDIWTSSQVSWSLRGRLIPHLPIILNNQ